MATSELGYYVRFDEALVEGASSADDPFDTGIARRAVQNLDHLADQYGQILVNWASPSTGDYFDIDADTIVDDTDYTLWRSAPFDLAVAPFLRADDGASVLQSYRCRCRLLVTSNHASAAAKFRGVLAPLGYSQTELQELGVNVTNQISVASTSITWEDASSLIYLDDILVTRATKTDCPALDAIGDATISVTWLRAQLVVFGQRDTSSASPRLFGVHLSQYMPPA